MKGRNAKKAACKPVAVKKQKSVKIRTGIKAGMKMNAPSWA